MDEKDLKSVLMAVDSRTHAININLLQITGAVAEVVAKQVEDIRRQSWETRSHIYDFTARVTAGLKELTNIRDRLELMNKKLMNLEELAGVPKYEVKPQDPSKKKKATRKMWYDDLQAK